MNNFEKIILNFVTQKVHFLALWYYDILHITQYQYFIFQIFYYIQNKNLFYIWWVIFVALYLRYQQEKERSFWWVKGQSGDYFITKIDYYANGTTKQIFRDLTLLNDVWLQFDVIYDFNKVMLTTHWQNLN